MTNNFKLLAIRPLKNCDKKFLKNLDKGTIYKFYNEYTFKDSNGNEIIESLEDVSSVTHTSKVPVDFYQIENNGNTINFNISALVGKNGSGKSSLLELLYASCFRIASRKRVLEGDEHGLIPIEYIPYDPVKQRESNSKLNEIKRLISSLNVEIFYSINEKIYCINISKEQGIIHKIIEGKDEYLSKWLLDEPIEKYLKYVFNDAFFYNISINYSLYGLNDIILGGWIRELFHKNDGYQTPLVINPFRTNGNIDVNSELHLAQTRFFTNSIYTIENSTVNDKNVGAIDFKLDLTESYSVEKINTDNHFTRYKSEFKLSEKEFICKIYNIFYDLNLTENEIYTPTSGSLIQQSKYIFYKILKISRKYKEYNKYEILKEYEINLEEFDAFLSVLCKDKSHITLKLRQTLNNLRFNWFDVKEGANLLNLSIDFDFDNDIDLSSEFKHRILLSELIQIIKITKEENDFLKYEELIPLGCHSITLYIINNKLIVSDLTNMVELSSGEQHFIFSIQSILYHLININSVFNSESPKIKYKYVNIILDEIELYFHPEFQRTFAYELIKRIQTLSIPHIESINIIFCTHSPFILSDIPKENTLKLDNGSIMPYDIAENTFGANIHDLLAKDFFLKDGFIGEFAKQKIENIIFQLNLLELIIKRNALKDDTNYTEIEKIEKEKSYLEEIESFKANTSFEKFTNDEIELKINKDKRNIEQIIKLIGEPVYKHKLKSMFDNVFISDKKELKIAEIKRLLENNGLTKDDLDL